MVSMTVMICPQRASTRRTMDSMSRSEEERVMRVESAPYGTLIAVYTTVVHRLYATKIYQNCSESEVCGTVNSATAVIA